MAVTMCAKGPSSLLLLLPLLLSPGVLVGDACQLTRGPEGGWAEPSMPLPLGCMGPWATSASPPTQDCPLPSQEKKGFAQESRRGSLHRWGLHDRDSCKAGFGAGRETGLLQESLLPSWGGCSQPSWLWLTCQRGASHACYAQPRASSGCLFQQLLAGVPPWCQ